MFSYALKANSIERFSLRDIPPFHRWEWRTSLENNHAVGASLR
jgi:hypothetical protein